MSWRKVLTVCVLASLVAACVTETKGRQPLEASDTEAADINLQLGVGYLRQGDLPAAQVKLEKAIAQNPKLVTAHTALALVYEQLGDIEGAEREYRRAVQLEPRNPDALNYLGQFLCRQAGRQQEAIVIFARAVEVPLSETYYNKAMVFTNAGLCAKHSDLAQAETYLRSALGNDPRYAEALLQLSDVTFRRENYLQARAFLERYLAAAPPSPAALWLGVQIETALGDGGAAQAYAQSLKDDFPESVETRRVLENERNAG